MHPPLSSLHPAASHLKGIQPTLSPSKGEATSQSIRTYWAIVAHLTKVQSRVTQPASSLLVKPSCATCTNTVPVRQSVAGSAVATKLLCLLARTEVAQTLPVRGITLQPLCSNLVNTKGASSMCDGSPLSLIFAT